jgi:hypothetical protein
MPKQNKPESSLRHIETVLLMKSNKTRPFFAVNPGWDESAFFKHTLRRLIIGLRFSFHTGYARLP